MAFQAPRHAVRFGVINHRHVIDLAVATAATDPAIHVRGVIVKNVIGRAMNLHPLDRVTRFPARPHRLELRIIFLHLRVAIHAGLRVRHIRMRRDIDKAVAITAIHPELRDVKIMRKRHRLDRLITDARIFRRHVIPGRAGQSANDNDSADRELERQPVRPAWKKIRHKRSATRRGVAAAQTTSENFCETIKQVQRSRVKVRFARAKRTAPLYKSRQRMAKENSSPIFNSFFKKLHAGFVRETCKIDNVKTWQRVNVKAPFFRCSCLVVLTLVSLSSRMHAAEDVDLVFVNGNIYTVNERQPHAEAIAVRGERIVFVGSNEDAKKLRATRVIDLAGRNGRARV